MRLAVSVSIVLSLAFFAHAQRVDVKPPIKLVTFKKDRTEVAGQLVAYGDDDFQVVDGKKQTLVVRWDELEARNVFQIHERLIIGAGEKWIAVAEQIATLPDGRPWAERALVKAVNLDPEIKAKVEEVRRSLAKSVPATRATTQALTSADPPNDPDAPAAPRIQGAIDRSAWGKQSDEQTALAIKQAMAFADRAKREVNGNLSLYETKYFLFYSDLRTSEAQQWAGVLDRMYARLGELFGVPDGSNIWRGKALIFVFASAGDYRKFQQVMHDTDSAGTAGMSHGFGNGDVHIAFYRQPDDLEFAHVLVHESTHGFLHRYRSPERIPSWANEGLAEVIASELVPRKARVQRVEMLARELIRRRHGVGDLLDADHISGPQYQIAYSLCAFMIRENKRGYVAFINGIKDGMSARDALAKEFGAPASRLIPSFAESMGVKGITFRD